MGTMRRRCCIRTIRGKRASKDGTCILLVRLRDQMPPQHNQSVSSWRESNPRLRREQRETYHSVESITTDQSDGVTQDCFADCCGRTQSRSRNHDLLWSFNNQSGIQLDIIRMIVELSQFQSEILVRSDILKLFMLDETEKVAEFVQ